VSALLTSLALEREASPLHQDAHGVIHVAQTRVTLESVISLLEQGANAEEITLRYDVLNLRDVYATPRLLPRPSAGGASVRWTARVGHRSWHVATTNAVRPWRRYASVWPDTRTELMLSLLADENLDYIPL